MKGKAHILYKRITLAMIILVMGCLLVNQALYTHTHVMPDGSIVSHAHPFSKNAGCNKNTTHQHSSAELFLLYLLNVLILCALAAFVLKRSASTNLFREASLDRLLPALVPVSPGRAPPTYM
ncbi:MAG: hypothetical protein IMY68_02490 [Bacteroidetes bacterium]|nr:hypothetical protein [Bacteroidota bacterium]